MRERWYPSYPFAWIAVLRRGGWMFAAAGLLLYAGLASQAQTQPAPGMAPAAPPAIIGLAQPMSSEEVDRYAITIFPDGRNLPPGQGSVARGAQLYVQHCAACHGAQGVEGPASRLVGSDGFIAWNDLLRPLRVRQYPLQVLSVGAMWPYATTVFDYVRRGMPMHAPKSLTDDEVYAVTAHLLHWNGLVAANAVMDKESLPQVVMPGRDRTVSAWPLGR
ncbi:c-type cytochrome [Acidovorax kalamii]|uniref:c-type cytochrome n=1 Tax=Acidovorax kalamii TaxID=2004485 RepID=UPI002090FB54|nr:cytochrome c [Acidovorax kalamii]MCO5356636.1 cytochrome c [Acidovorax kalamii]